MKNDSEKAVFECSMIGRNWFAVSQTGLHVGDHVAIKYGDQEDSILDKFIKFGADESGYVHTIKLVQVNKSDDEPQADCYDYKLLVEAAGPSSGWGYLYFIDRTRDCYKLGIFNSSQKEHFLKYNSSNPDIIAIIWMDSNDSE